MSNTTTSSTQATEQIEDLQRQIEQLKHRAVLELKVKLAEARALVVDLQSQIEKMTGEAVSEKTSTRKPRTSVTIDQVVAAIKAGASNYRTVAAKLGSSTATVTKKVKAEGKAAGITSVGQKASFRLMVK